MKRINEDLVSISLAAAYLVVCVILIMSLIVNVKAYAPTIEVAEIPTTTSVVEETVYIPETTIFETETTTEKQYSLTMEEIELIALVTMAEAEGEPELGQRLVIDTILNRVDDKRFPNTVKGVIYQPNQFEAMWNGRADRCEVRDYFVQMVKEELESRANHHVIFFQMNCYSKYGTPMFSIGSHYFSEY
jgi:N-acetylmuramoyl-L-alanine amidase